MSEFDFVAYKCTEYFDDDDCYDSKHLLPCQCPVCKGFLSWDETGEIPICNKCGAELAKIPEIDEETKEEIGCGKICALSPAKINRKDSVKFSRKAKENKKAWSAYWR